MKPLDIIKQAEGTWFEDEDGHIEEFRQLFFVCHDAPVIVFQTDNLAHFISEGIQLGHSPWKSEISDVHETSIIHSSIDILHS